MGVEGLFQDAPVLRWSYDDKRELFSLAELAQYFDLDRVGNTGGAFNVETLEENTEAGMVSLSASAVHAETLICSALSPWLMAARGPVEPPPGPCYDWAVFAAPRHGGARSRPIPPHRAKPCPSSRTSNWSPATRSWA